MTVMIYRLNKGSLLPMPSLPPLRLFSLFAYSPFHVSYALCFLPFTLIFYFLLLLSYYL